MCQTEVKAGGPLAVLSWMVRTNLVATLGVLWRILAR